MGRAHDPESTGRSRESQALRIGGRYLTDQPAESYRPVGHLHLRHPIANGVEAAAALHGERKLYLAHMNARQRRRLISAAPLTRYTDPFRAVPAVATSGTTSRLRTSSNVPNHLDRLSGGV